MVSQAPSTPARRPVRPSLRDPALEGAMPASLAGVRQGVATHRPAYLLRVPDAEARARAHALFVEDLKFAWRLAA